MVCPTCSKDWPSDRFRHDGDDCFKCRVSTVSLGFAAGKDMFHSVTKKEWADRSVKDFTARNGYAPEPVSTVYTGR